MPDADLGPTVPAIMGSAFGAAGQRCLAGSVAVMSATQTRQDEVRDALAAAAAELQSAQELTPETDVCPLVAPEARERAEARSQRVEADGADVRARRPRAGRRPGRTFLGPTIVDASTPNRSSPARSSSGPFCARAGPDLDEPCFRQRLALRQRGVDLHVLGRGGARLPPRRSRRG